LIGLEDAAPVQLRVSSRGNPPRSLLEAIRIRDRLNPHLGRVYREQIVD
jgi:hypothetical protein